MIFFPLGFEPTSSTSKFLAIESKKGQSYLKEISCPVVTEFKLVVFTYFLGASNAR